MSKSENALPKRTEWLYKGFAWYANRMVKRSFESMAVDDQAFQTRAIEADVPVIVCANHPSWWDPILAVLLHEFVFPQRKFYAPIDADALKKYEVFRKLGFYPTQSSSHAGVASFLKSSKAILNEKKTAIWLTPEGKFSDARDHSNPLMPGLSHVFLSAPRVAAIPLAIEYSFWNERKPYMLMRLGEPIYSDELGTRDKVLAGQVLNDSFRSNQKELAKLVLGRSLAPFRIVKQATQRPGNLYDVARLTKSIFKRQSVQLRHGND